MCLVHSRRNPCLLGYLTMYITVSSIRLRFDLLDVVSYDVAILSADLENLSRILSV